MNNTSPMGTLELSHMQLVPSGAHAEFAAGCEGNPCKTTKQTWDKNLGMPVT